MACSILPGDTAFASNVVAYADCQARTIGQAGYLALAAPGGTVPALLTILVTIAVALVGYRLILAELPQPREVVVMLVKLGFVLAFATGWAAYRPVVYDVAMNSPSELAGTIGGAAGLVTGPALPLHLDAVDGQFQQLSIENVDHPAPISQTGPVPPPLFANFDVFALGSARIVFLTSALVSYAAPRLLAGLLLALGPLFVAFLLFDATRGLAEAWLGALAGAALATLAASVMLGVEVGLVEPWLKLLIARRVAGQPMPAMPTQLLVVALVFAGVLAIVWLGAALAMGRVRIMLANRTVALPGWAAGAKRTAEFREGASTTSSTSSPGERSRAAAVAEAALALHRRENAGAAVGQGGPPMGLASATRAVVDGPGAALAAGGSTLRRTSIRRSGSAMRRDRRA